MDKRREQLNEQYRADFEVRCIIHTDEPEKLEQLFHAVLSPDRVTYRREWFHLSKKQLELLEALEHAQERMFSRGYMCGRDEPSKNAWERGYDAGVTAGYEQALANEESQLTYWREYEEKKERYGAD